MDPETALTRLRRIDPLHGAVVLVALATFVVLFAAIALLIRDQAEQRFEVTFARDATQILSRVETQAELTSRDLAQLRVFVETTDPTVEQWHAFIDSTDANRDSWLDNTALVRLVRAEDLDAFIAADRAAGNTRLTRPSAVADGQWVALVTRASRSEDAQFVSFDLFAIPAAREILTDAARTNRAAVGVLPPAIRATSQFFGDRLGWAEEIGSVAAILPLRDRNGDNSGFLVTEFDLEDALANVAAAEGIGLAITFDGDITGAEAEPVDIIGAPSRVRARATDRRDFSTPLIRGTSDVWSLSAPVFGAAQLFAAALLALLAALAVGAATLIAGRMRQTRRRLGESERELVVDRLTGLRSRVGLERALAAELESMEESGEAVAVILLDLDRFKVINDSLGHRIGDEALRVVGDRLSANLSARDTIARFGGDEFVIVAPGVGGAEDAASIAHRLELCLREPVMVDGRALSVRGSFGVTVAAVGDCHDAESLLRDADVAMYEAKRASVGVRVFDTGLRGRAVDRLEMEEATLDALEHGWLRVDYQPIVSMPTASLVGVEALVRLEHPTLGRLAPGRFLPVAQEAGLIGRIGTEVLADACLTARRLNERFPDRPPVQISVNIAEAQALDPGLVDQVRRLLGEFGVDGSQLCLELSEDALVENLGEALPMFHELSAVGVGLSIDDFGTGRSSMSHLRPLSLVSEVKIDRTFVAGLGSPGSDAQIVGAIVDLAAALDARIVAEGVETRDQWDRLLALGVSHAQGYLISRPRPAEAIFGWAAGGPLIAVGTTEVMDPPAEVRAL